MDFKLDCKLTPKGDQPAAIKEITDGIAKKLDKQTILGATGTGKTFVMANIINNTNRTALVLTHNKTLAAQLCAEFKEFFPHNSVNYFVSYYDYYQPEAYMPASDTFIQKDATINEEIDKYRHAATRDLLSRKDCIIVSTVSCIYGIGDKEEYEGASLKIDSGQRIDRREIMEQLITLQYHRNDEGFDRGKFRVRGDVIEVYPPYSNTAVRIEMFDDEVEKITETDPLTSQMFDDLQTIVFFPAKHAITSKDKIEKLVPQVVEEMERREKEFQKNGQNIEAQRIRERTMYDMEILKETGYVSGIENYTRYLSKGDGPATPNTLLNYFPDDTLVFIDESHITVPQIGGMHAGDHARKKTLIAHGFRLESAFDNRPLNFGEFDEITGQTVYVSATPSKYEEENSQNTAQLIIRPTGLLDPVIEVRPTKNQIDNLTKEVNDTIKAGFRVLITTLTKKMSEELSEYYTENNYKVKYLHSEIDNLQRMEIIAELRRGDIDILIGINLLREGLDLPEVSLVAILDADKEGFLRSRTSLIQTIGRAARNSEGRVIMYADKHTNSMNLAIDETNRRREIQQAYNKEHGITPKTIIKEVRDIREEQPEISTNKFTLDKIPKEDVGPLIAKLEIQMDEAVANLNFETAADLRDEIEQLKTLQ